jgi:hypothetical protein
MNVDQAGQDGAAGGVNLFSALKASGQVSRWANSSNAAAANGHGPIGNKANTLTLKRKKVGLANQQITWFGHLSSLNKVNSVIDQLTIEPVILDPLDRSHQQAMGVVAITGDSNNGNHRRLPGVLPVNFGHRDIELVSQAGYNTFKDMALIFE